MGAPSILLNFFLVTIVGGMFTAYVSALRDSISKREAALSALRDLIKQVDELYRATKQIKRMIRSRLSKAGEEYEIAADFFAARMDDLSNTQLKLEQVRNNVRTRSDLFFDERKKRILKEIEYSEKYFNDVIEEFEKRFVLWEGGACRIPVSCTMLIDFLGERWMLEEIQGEFETMEDADTSEERFRAFESIIEKVKAAGPNWVRHKTIADECMLLVIKEMRDLVVESQRQLTSLGVIAPIFVPLVRVPWLCATLFHVRVGGVAAANHNNRRSLRRRDQRGRRMPTRRPRLYPSRSPVILPVTSGASQ